MFRSKKLDLGCFVNVKVIRDHTKRKVFAANEVERCVSRISPQFPLLLARGSEDTQLSSKLMVVDRQSLRYIIRNLSLPARTRAMAQLQLAQMHCYTRSTQIRNRCIEGGKGRGILSDFKMSRVCAAKFMIQWRNASYLGLDGLGDIC